METLEQQTIAFRSRVKLLEEEIGKVFVGQAAIVEQLLMCLFSRGHALVEGVPGLGKTLLVKTLSEVLDLRFSRIQCTPDLMPADIIGTNMLIEDGRGNQSVRFQKGPLFANIVLTDEINRATPKTQSAFLEAMQEHRVTVLGKTYELEEPFFLVATQNPIEMEGTYPLPEAQLDRFFFKLKIESPEPDELSRILDLTTDQNAPSVKSVCVAAEIQEMTSLVRKVKIAEDVKRYAMRIMQATHPDSSQAVERVRRFVRYGASPRAAQSMILAGKVKALRDGRYNVSYDDIREVATPALGHRFILNFEGEVASIHNEDLVVDILSEVKPG